MATRVSLRDSYGRVIPLNVLERGDTATEIRVRVLGETPPGKYSVTWRITGRDGHPVTGSFTLTIASAGIVAPDTTPTRVPGDADTRPVSFATGTSPLFVTVRSGVFLSMIALIGAVAFSLAIVPRAERSLAEPRAAWHDTARRVGLVAAAACVASLSCRLLLQWQLVDIDGSTDLWSVAGETAWGRAWLLQAAAAAVALVAFALVRHRGVRVGVTALAGAGIAIGASLSGHPAASALPAVAVLADAVHVIGASAWIGGLLCVMLVVWLEHRSEAGSGMRRVAAVVAAFSPVALVAAGAVVVTGIVSAYLRVGVDPPWSSLYVRVLLLKLAVLAVLWVCGAYNWLKVRPSLARATGSSDLHRSGFIELALGALVIVITAALVAIPLPAGTG